MLRVSIDVLKGEEGCDGPTLASVLQPSVDMVRSLLPRTTDSELKPFNDLGEGNPLHNLIPTQVALHTYLCSTA